MPLAIDGCAPKTRRTFLCIGLGGCLAGLVGCSEAKPVPRPARIGRESCRTCGMPITDARLVAEIWDAEYGRVRVYDEFGCAVLDAQQRKELDRPDLKFWVADETEPSRWLEARQAHYRSGIDTPMGHGYAAGPPVGHPVDYTAAVAAIRNRALCDHQERGA